MAGLCFTSGIPMILGVNGPPQTFYSRAGAMQPCPMHRNS